MNVKGESTILYAPGVPKNYFLYSIRVKLLEFSFPKICVFLLSQKLEVH